MSNRSPVEFFNRGLALTWHADGITAPKPLRCFCSASTLIIPVGAYAHWLLAGQIEEMSLECAIPNVNTREQKVKLDRDRVS